jgi:hypothetical protein
MLADLLQSRRARERGIFATAQVDKWIDQNHKTKLDTLVTYARANRLYSIALLEQWHRTFVDDPQIGGSGTPRASAYANLLA